MRKRFTLAVMVTTLVVAFGSAASAATLRGVIAITGVSTIEAEIVSLVNADRRAAGLHGLSVNAWAADTSRAHSEAMAAAGDIWHNREVYFAQGRSAMGATLLGENVVQTFSAREAQSAFMESDLHRQNILDSRFTHIGVGVALNGEGVLFVTQAFARIAGGGTTAVAGEVAKPAQQAAAPVQPRVARPARAVEPDTHEIQPPPEVVADAPAAATSVLASDRVILVDSHTVVQKTSGKPSGKGINVQLVVVAAMLAAAGLVVLKVASGRLAG